MIVVAAVAIAVTAVHREFSTVRGRPPGLPDAPPAYEPMWNELVQQGILVGDSAARIKIVEFADLECPFCKRFHDSFLRAQRDHPRDLALVFIHYPIAQHRFARPAARASECARAQRRFPQFVDGVFRKQDSLGLKAWISFAQDAAVPDTVEFARCNARTSPLFVVESGLAQGRRAQVHATPTVIINGWRFSSPPYDSLGPILTRIIEGKAPLGTPDRFAPH